MGQVVPLCAKCNKPVDHLHQQQDPFMGRLRFIARCHGETQVVEIPLEGLRMIDGFCAAFGQSTAITKAKTP